MANENIGVFRKLNNHSIPWHEKIKVAQRAWDSDQCIIPNKQQVLLDWVLQQLVDIYKKNKSKDAIKDLWEYLVHILSSLDSKTDHKKTTFALMPQILQVFIEVFTSTDFETSDVSLKVLHCGQIILSNPELNLTLLAKFENYLLYLSSLLKTFSTLNGDKITNKAIHKEAFCLLEISLNLYIPLQRRQTNHKKLFEKACQHLLVPIVSVWNCLMGSEQTEGSINGFVNLLQQALSDAIFRKEHLSEYASSLKALNIQQSSNDADCQEPKPKKAKIGNYTKELFETLRNQCSQVKDDNDKNIMNFLPQLFIEFLKSRRFNNLSSSSLEFEFFTEMCSLLGVKFSEEEESPLLSYRVIGLVYTLLNTLLSYDVYQVAEDNANGKIQFKWFTGFITILLKMQSSNEVFECLQVLLQLNHYIIEPYLTTVLQISWRNDCQEGKDASASDLFLSALVKTYTKLRQFDKFVGQLLKSLPGAADITTKWTGLPKHFQYEMVKACQVLPYGLATTLWKLFNQEIIDNYLSTLQILSQSKGKANNQEKEKVFCFERVVGLYQTFLENTALGRVAEQHKTEAIVTNVTNLCQDMVDNVIGPAFEVLPHVADNKLHKSVSTSVLVLYHTLQEMNTYLGKFGLISHDEHCKIATDQWNKYLLTHFNHKQKRKGKEKLIFVKVLIAIQRVRSYMRSVVSPVEEKETQKLVDFLFHWLEDSFHWTNDSAWNLQLWSINTTTFDAAYWFTLCSFAPILLTICTDKQQQQFTYYLIKTLLHQNVDSVRNHGSDITLQLSSRMLVFSASFHQIPSVHQCFIATLWAEISKLLSESSSEIHKKLCKIMTSAGMAENQSDNAVDASEDSNESSSEDESSSDEESQEQIAIQKADNIPCTVLPLVPTGKVLIDILESLCSGEHLDELDSETASKVSEHITLLTFLPLDWLSDCDHVWCFIALLACDALSCGIQNRELNEESLRVSFVSKRLLTVFLQGCISRKRYLIQHVVDIDSLHSWILMSCLRLKSTEVNSLSEKLHNISIDVLMALMKFALKIGKPLTLIDGFIHKLVLNLESLTTKIRDQSKKSIHKALKRDHSLLEVAGAVVNVLEKVISCKTSRLNEIKMAVHVFSKCAPPILNLLQTMTAENRSKKSPLGNDVKSSVVLEDNHVLIDIYTAVLHVYSISQTSRKFSRSKDEFQVLPWRPLLDWILSFATDSIIQPKKTSTDSGSNEEEQHLLILPSMKSSLHFLNIIMSSLDTLQVDVNVGFHKNLLDSVLNLLHHLDINDVDLNKTALNVILSMLQGCSSDMAVNLLKELSNVLALHSKSPKQLWSCLQVWLTLLAGKFLNVRKRELRSVLPQVLMALQSIAHQPTNFDLKILSLELMTRILSLGPNMLYPHHSSLVFHGSLLVQLDHNSNRFPDLFCAQFSLLSTALFHHNEAVFKTMHVFMACVTNMLNSLCHYCSIKIVRKTKKRNQETQTKCADKMSRLYQEISSHKAAISKYIPYMITEYIQQIQEHQLQEQVKKLLEAGIYCLIDASGEHEIALLHATLDRGSRELFTTLINEYNKFYKFKGKV